MTALDIEAPKADDPIRAALERLINAKPDPVFTAAFDTLRNGAPGLSETTCSALARSIAIKVKHGPEARAAEASSAELIAQRATLVNIVQELEDACERLSANRDQATYDAMVANGMTDALIELDDARRNARAALSSITGGRE